MNFLRTPLLAWVLGFLMLSNHPYLWIGFMMLMVTPCTDWYLVYTQISKGNIALSTAILPINLILQLSLLPIYLLLFSEIESSIDLSGLLESILIVFVIPFLSAQFSRHLIMNLHGEQYFAQKITPFLPRCSLVFSM